MVEIILPKKESKNKNKQNSLMLVHPVWVLDACDSGRWRLAHMVNCGAIDVGVVVDTGVLAWRIGTVLRC